MAKNGLPVIPICGAYDTEKIRGKRSSGKKRKYHGFKKKWNARYRKRSLKWPSSIASMGTSENWSTGSVNTGQTFHSNYSK